ncbi:hypothetical protein CTAYLR_001269 [Chrysophaeum taylorii]|uniref:Glycosyltransferase family 92 protein n=1 Tax=Chrysophaeum taylorii TaxID=2483200 RepID=A0AAD7XLF1_9STRA|nr:hypothetical protein CTAYLR_001269 [Chrysophaeum taylorii]
MSFVRWHLALGFERLYLYFDDAGAAPVGLAELEAYLEKDEAAGERVERVRRTEKLADEERCLCASFERFGPFVDAEVQARQALNAEHASIRARERGLRWLVHIDIDELFFASNRRAFLEHFAAMDASEVGHVTYANHEGVPEAGDAVDYFASVTLFRVNHLRVPLSDAALRAMQWWRDRTRRGQYLLCYDNGKSAVRLVEGVAPTSVHAWSLGAARLRRRTALCDARALAVEDVDAALDEPCVLHYVACGKFWLRTKYEILGDFDDAWFGGALPIAASFHLDSRDVVVGSGDAAVFDRFYDAHLAPPDRDTIRRHLDAGVLRSYTAVKTFLRGTHCDDGREERCLTREPATERCLENTTTTTSTQLQQPTTTLTYEKAWILSSAANSFLSLQKKTKNN